MILLYLYSLGYLVVNIFLFYYNVLFLQKFCMKPITFLVDVMRGRKLK